MRFRSTLTSAQQGTPTVFAVIECVASVALYVWIAAELNSIIPFAVAVACAPLFLLRTRYSVALALGLWQRVFDWLDRTESKALVLLIPLAMASGAFIRAGATLIGLLKHPLVTIRSIPRNWYRQTLCLDFFSPPEIIPGETNLDNFEMKFSDFVQWCRYDLRNEIKQESPILSILVIIFTLSIFVCGYLPSIILRISFKATSLVYAPLIWVTHATTNRRDSLRLRVKRITEGELEKARRWASGVIISVLVGKVLLAQQLVEREYIMSLTKSRALTDQITDGWPWWQVALAFDALLTFVLFYYADAVEDRMEVSGVNEAQAKSLILSGSFLRGMVAILSVGYAFSAFVIVLVDAVRG